MDGKRQVLQNEANIAGMVLDGFLNGRIRLEAERTLVVKKFNDSDRRFGVSVTDFRAIISNGPLQLFII